MANELRSLSKGMSLLPSEMVRQGTKQVRGPVLARVARDSGGDRRLSGIGNVGQFKVTTKVTGTVFVEGRVFAGPGKMRGPWSWLESGTTRKRHGRTRGKGTWSEPVEAELPKVQRTLERMFEAAVRKG